MSTQPPPSKRSRPGRSSRRRKRKAQSILNAAASLVETNARTSSTAAVPSDRGITLEGVRIRRQEFRRLKANNFYSVNSIGSEGDGLLDPSDEQQLISQLGFVPGNVICVAARLTSEFDTSTSLTNGGKVRVPSVAKLYPMAVRDSYHGGKSDGRKFKGRRRGGMRTVDGIETETCDGAANSETAAKSGESNDGNLHGSITAAAGKSTSNESVKQPSKERCWFIETSCNAQENGQPKRQIIEPFPTLFWLTSPTLRSYISQIELSKTNGVQSMEQRLRSSQQYLDQMKRAHKSYGKDRWELLTDVDREEVLKRGWGEALGVGRGVAGIRPKKNKHIENDNECDGNKIWDGVKCLHAHAAHYLAQVEQWREKRQCEQGSMSDVELDTNDMLSLIQSCDGNDLNLVGRWTMEAVLELLQTQKSPVVNSYGG